MQDQSTRRSLFNATDFADVVNGIGNRPMFVTPSQACLLLSLAITLGLLADALFNGAALGANLPMWLVCVTTAFVVGSRRLASQVDKSRLSVLVVATAVSSLVVWHDSRTLCAMDVVTASGLVLFAVARPTGLGYRRLSPLDLAIAGWAGFVALVFAVWRLGALMPWQRVPAFRSEAAMVGRGLLVATPIFLTFGGLFFAADAVFAAEVRESLRFDTGAVQSHVLWIIGGTWLAASILWSGLAVPAPTTLSAELPPPRQLTTPEVAIVLGPLALLFGLFVIVQLRYLFGGEAAVQHSINLTYSEYARHGFFELVIASALLLPVLTGMNWARRRAGKSGIAFALLALTLVGLLFVVMASAWQRLSLYMDAFGLTELRFYSATALPWLAVAFVWFLLSLALRKSESFFAGTTIAALLLLTVLNVVSPSAVIARTNLDRSDSERGFDANYTLGLGADAVPTLLQSIDQLNDTQRCLVERRLVDRWSAGDGDIRGWNWSRSRAHRDVARQQARLVEGCNQRAGRASVDLTPLATRPTIRDALM